MTVGTKIFLAVFAIFIGVLVLYYGVLMPGSGASPASASITHGPQAPAVRPNSAPDASHQKSGDQASPPKSDTIKPVGSDQMVLVGESAADSAITGTAADRADSLSNEGNQASPPSSRPLANPSVAMNIADPTGPESSPPTHTPAASGAGSPNGSGSTSSSTHSASKTEDVKTVGGNGRGMTPPGVQQSKPTQAVPSRNAPLGPPPAATPTKPQPQAGGDSKTNRATPPQTFEYVVKSGDTGSSIAEAWFGDKNKWTLISKANPLVDFRKLQIGQKLRLPAKDAPVESIKEQVAADKTSYTVRPGDTLAKIARELYNDVSKWELIYDANKATIGSDPADLKPGMKLKLPPGASASASSKPKST